MADKEQVLEELSYLTSTISTQVRTISAGVLAFCWAFALQAQGDGSPPFTLGMDSIVLPAALSLIVLMLDLIQYLCGYILNRTALEILESGENFSYNRRGFFYLGRVFSFYGKIILSISAVVWVTVITLSKIL